MNIYKFEKKNFIKSTNNESIKNNTLNLKKFIFFSKIELTSILNLYSKQVSKGYWRDYALDSTIDNAIFSIYRHSHDKPIYQIIKNSQKGFRNKPIFLIKKSEKIIGESNRLIIILSYFEKKLSIKKLKNY